MDKFNLVIVHESFRSSLSEEDDVLLRPYLDSYEELNKFFNLMGTVFGFVSKDLKAKIDILAELLQKENSSNFVTAKQMLNYEKEEELLNKKGYMSGSRTLLRLHRGLDFIRLFLKSIGDLKDEDNVSTVCREAYDQTLAKYHPFVIRKGAQLAMYTMPTRETLLRKVCGESEEDIKNVLNVLPQTLDVAAEVHGRIENLYTSYNLHSLP